jgi:outer membrane translocation and assembly module TamA
MDKRFENTPVRVVIQQLDEKIEELERLVEKERNGQEYLAKRLKAQVEKAERYEKALKFAVEYLQSSDIKQVQMVVKRLKEELID